MSRPHKWSTKFVEGFRIPEVLSEELFRSAINYKPRGDDIFVVSYPKSGTTWAIHILTLIFRQGEPFGENFNFLEMGPFLEMGGPQVIEMMSRPGPIKIHLPFRLAPWSDDAKYVNVARNPKDACVSLFYHMKNTPGHGYDGTFDDFFEDYLSGEIEFGDYFDHVLGWYEHRNDPNVLFITYEEMKENPEAAIFKMASFIDDQKYAEPLRKDRQKLENVIKYSSFDEMKVVYNKFVDNLFTMSPEDVKNLPFPEETKQMFQQLMQKHASVHGSALPKPSSFIRKGINGDWRNHFSEDQSRRMDEKFAKRMAGTELLNIWKEYM